MVVDSVSRGCIKHSQRLGESLLHILQNELGRGSQTRPVGLIKNKTNISIYIYVYTTIYTYVYIYIYIHIHIHIHICKLLGSWQRSPRHWVKLLQLRGPNICCLSWVIEALQQQKSQPEDCSCGRRHHLRWSLWSGCKEICRSKESLAIHRSLASFVTCYNFWVRDYQENWL